MKSFSAEALSALAEGTAIVSGAIFLGTAPTPLRVWGGYGLIVIEDEVFSPVGDAGLIKVSAGTLGGAEVGAEVTLSTVDPDALAITDLTVLRGVAVVVWRLIFDSSGVQLLQASVYLRGRIDEVTTSETPGGSASITLKIEGAARGLGRRSGRMRTDADQRLISETDGSLRRVSHAGEKVIYAGGKPPVRAGQAIGGSGPGYGGGSGGGGGDGGDYQRDRY